MIPTQQKAQQFQELHAQDQAFIIPNPWDIGSAKLFAACGFKALATTSSGHAYSLGKIDGELTLTEALAHYSSLAEATELPISADWENGFADDPEQLGLNLERLRETGVVGASIEDYDGHSIYDYQLAVERIQAAVEVKNRWDIPFVLTARAENLIRGVKDIDDTLKRLQAFERAGADVLYAPGLGSLEEVAYMRQHLTRPINVLASYIPNAGLSELKVAGAKRVSIGGAMAQSAYGFLLSGADEMLKHGTFSWLTKRHEGQSLAQYFAKAD